jgi:hypothetical protein
MGAFTITSRLGSVSLLAAVGLACEPNVVDAVREPREMPEPVSPLETSLIHRYSFDGTGATVVDSIGAAHGEVIGTELSGNGTLSLMGEHTAQHVNLPNRLISGLSSATLEFWLTWDGGGPWQRIFDFGNSTSGEGMPGTDGTTYLFLTTASAFDGQRMLPPGLRAVFSLDRAADEEVCHASEVFPSARSTHVALVVDAARRSMSLYQDGALLNACDLTRPLSMVEDVNNWLGRSNYEADVDLAGAYDEFRIYSAALTAEELAASYAGGPDAGPP